MSDRVAFSRARPHLLRVGLTGLRLAEGGEHTHITARRPHSNNVSRQLKDRKAKTQAEWAKIVEDWSKRLKDLAPNDK